jgi:hypothetical protein
VLAVRLSARDAAAAAAKVLAAHDANTNGDYRFWLGDALEGLAGRLDEQAAAAVTTAVLDALDKNDGDALNKALPTLAGRLGQREAAGVARRIGDALGKWRQQITRENALRALAVLADRLDGDVAAAVARQILAMFRLASVWSGMNQYYGVTLAALASRMGPGPAREVCTEAAKKIREELTRRDLPSRPHGNLARGLAGLVPYAEENVARDAAATACATLLEDLPRTERPDERAGLLAGLAALAGRMSEPDATAVASAVLGPLERVEDAGERLAFIDLLGALAGRLDKAQVAAAAVKVLGELVRTGDNVPPARFLAALAALAERLDRPGLLDLLRHPACVRAARSVVLRRCERLLNHPFADVWESTDWLAANDPGGGPP